MPKTNLSIPVKHIARLAHIPITEEEEKALEVAFVETLLVVDQLKSVDVTDVAPTSQVTGLENVWRDDVAKVIDTFTQLEALANAKRQYQGFFVVPQVIDQD